MQEQSCPNCGGAGPEVLAHGDYRCRFCGTVFRDDKAREQKIADERRQAAIRAQELQYQAKMQHAIANTANRKRTFLFVGLMLLLVFGVIGFFTVQALNQQKEMQDEIMDQQKKMQEEMMKQFQQ